MSEPKQVGGVDAKKYTSVINPPKVDPKTEVVCWFNNQSYSPGATVCSNGDLLRCSQDGSWTVVGTC